MKTMKKILCAILVVVMCLTSAPLSGFVGLDFKVEAVNYKVGDIIKFGSYPQTEVKDQTLIAQLNDQNSTWISYGYTWGDGTYGSEKVEDYMQYADVFYNGSKYRGVKYSKERPFLSFEPSADTYKIKWYLYESIEWYVADPSSGKLFATKAVDSQPWGLTNSGYTDTTMVFNQSLIKTWLNSSFINIAFSLDDEKYLTEVQLPNYKDEAKIDNYKLGYTDYYLSQGGWSGEGWYWTNNIHNTQYIYVHSNTYGAARFFKTNVGVRPVIYIDLEAYKEANKPNDEVGATEYKVGDIIKFGSYPQTEVKDQTLIAQLNNQNSTWISYGYTWGDGTFGSEKVEDYMQYADIFYNGSKYRGVRYSEGRPVQSFKTSAETYMHDPGNIKWYLYEPIEWYVADPSSGKLFATKAVDSQPWGLTNSGYTQKAMVYTQSLIKTWLNSSFINTAFSLNDKKYLTEIRLPNYNDEAKIDNYKLGYTDYYLSQGGWSGEGWYWTNNLDCAQYIYVHSNTYGAATFNKTNVGVRPAVCVSLNVYDNTENVYDVEETYNFKNYTDWDSLGGHCFGMSITSSGYHLGFLDPSSVGATSSRRIYNLADSEIVRKPICYYQNLQGYFATSSIVAGGTNFKNILKHDINKDWDEVVNYVKNHQYDWQGALQIDYRTTGEKKYGHAVNFLYYDEANNQIAIYDNRYPNKTVMIKKTDNGEIVCNGDAEGVKIKSIAIRDVATYFSLVSKAEIVTEYLKKVIFSSPTSIIIDGIQEYLLSCGPDVQSQYVYELPKDQTTVLIRPLIDNATFTYMGEEYSFNEIDEDTYAEFTLSTAEEDEPEFEIVNAPHEHCYEEEKREASCTEQGYTTFTCDCGDTYTETIEANGHTDSEWIVDSASTCSAEGSKHIECTVCEEVLKTEVIEMPPHNMGTYVVTKPANCIEKGTEKSTCSECGYYTEKTIDKTDHNYQDGVCTVCHKTKVENCSHMCHKKGFMGFIWKIILFFNKLFKINRFCACGVAHY